MTVEKVILYRSVDQELHQTEQACLTRNFELQTRPQILELINRHDLNSDIPLNPLADIACDFILKFTPELVALLQPLVTPLEQPRRARRSKAEVTLEKAAKSVLESKAKAQATPAPTTVATAKATPQRDEGETGEIGSFSTNADALAAA